MKFWQRRKQQRLYRKWAEYADLPPEAVSPHEIPSRMKMGAREEDWFYRFRVRIWEAVGRILGVR